MNYFIDTEFLEGTQKKLFGNTKPTIDLISIGIVSEDGREYYAISKDFNIKEAWNRWQPWEIPELAGNEKKNYWLRENVLKSIFIELCNKENNIVNSTVKVNGEYYTGLDFTYKNFKYLIKKYGKPNKVIAYDILNFVHKDIIEKWDDGISFSDEIINLAYNVGEKTIYDFYGYYSDYDWVVFCWLFGKMIDLPKGFPMYCKDLKQTLDEKQNFYNKYIEKYNNEEITVEELPYPATRININRLPDYPKLIIEHNALEDAKWNKQLYEFLNTL